MAIQKKALAKTAVGVIRVSTDDQQLGPKVQKDLIFRWCAQHNVELIGLYEDLGVSGGAPLDRRPGLQAALAGIRAKKARILLVAKRDRLARDRGLAATVEAEVEKYGARVMSADGTGNGDGDGDFLVRGTSDLFAEYERRLIRTRTKAALAVKKARGERIGELPYGCELAQDGIHLESCEPEQEVIRKVNELRASGLSQRKIMAHLNECRLKNRAGGSWRLIQVQRILKKGAA